MSTFAQHCNNIERLNLRNCKKLSDRTCQFLARHCSKLQVMSRSSKPWSWLPSPGSWCLLLLLSLRQLTPCTCTWLSAGDSWRLSWESQWWSQSSSCLWLLAAIARITLTTVIKAMAMKSKRRSQSSSDDDLDISPYFSWYLWWQLYFSWYLWTSPGVSCSQPKELVLSRRDATNSGLSFLRWPSPAPTSSLSPSPWSSGLSSHRRLGFVSPRPLLHQPRASQLPRVSEHHGWRF